MDFRQL